MIDDQSQIERMRAGFVQLERLVAPTLGPTGGAVLHAIRGEKPSVLTETGIIGRRILPVLDRAENVGAMHFRNLVTSVHERHGDGAATAAVIARSLIDESTRLVAAGAHPVDLRQGMATATRLAADHLRAMATPLTGHDHLVQLAFGITGDRELSDVLGELFDMLGEQPALHIEELSSNRVDREYLDGGRWRARPAARLLMPEGGRDLVLNNPRLAIIDDRISTLDEVLPILEVALSLPERPPLVIVARDLTGDALNTLILNRDKGQLIIGAAILAAATGRLEDDFADLALMTGGTVFGGGAQRPVARATAEAFGHARRVTLNPSTLTMAGGGGNRPAIQEASRTLRNRRTELRLSREDDNVLRRRIARLSGGVGILKVGANTNEERNRRKTLAERAIIVLEQAQQSGVVPGGGVALLHCANHVSDAACREHIPDRREGMKLVARALGAPLRQLVRNRGLHHPPLIEAELARDNGTQGYDAWTGTVTSLDNDFVVDSAAVLTGALKSAVSCASMMLSTGAIVNAGNQTRLRSRPRKAKQR